MLGGRGWGRFDLCGGGSWGSSGGASAHLGDRGCNAEAVCKDLRMFCGAHDVLVQTRLHAANAWQSAVLYMNAEVLFRAQVPALGLVPHGCRSLQLLLAGLE